MNITTSIGPEGLRKYSIVDSSLIVYTCLIIDNPDPEGPPQYLIAYCRLF